MIAFFARRSWLLQPFLLLLLGIGVIIPCFLAFSRIDPDGFGRELLSAALGAVVTILTAAVVGLLALRKQVRAHIERSMVRRFESDSWRNSSIQSGGMEIPNMAVIASCTQGQSWTDRIDVTFQPTSDRPRDALVDATRDLWLPGLLEKAGTDYVLVDAPRADLTSAQLETRVVDSVRRPHYVLGVGSSTYFDFACSNARLDQEFQLEGDHRPRSLRERWDVHPSTLLDVGSLPASAPMGSGTVAVTRDGRMILGIRHKTFVAGSAAHHGARRPVHFVAEGLLPNDYDEDGVFSPAEGARRGLREELHVGPRSDHIARVESLIATGFCFDQRRWQPYFTFLARLDRSWDEIQTAAPTASDSWEVESLLSLPFSIEHAGVRGLLRGEHPDLVLASNHAAATLWFALLHEHGFQQLRDELSVPLLSSQK